MPKPATLWRFPREDFADWRQFVGATNVATFEAYEELLAQAAEELIAAGYEVEFWQASVQEMRDCLLNLHYDNTPANRAAVIAGRAPNGFGKVLGLKIGKNHIGSALIQRPELLGKAETPIADGDFRAAIREAIRTAEAS